jgi:hypothetical protein
MMTKTTVPKKRWTFMVYMAGDNNLDPNGVQDLKEMKKVGSTKDINIIAQFDRAAGHKAKRYYVRKGGTVNADAVATVGKENTGDPKVLAEFFEWGVKNHPADQYILVLWNHGQGWDDTDIFAGERHRAMRRLPTGRVRHSLFHTPVRRMLNRAIRDTEARAILIDDDAKDFLDNLEMKKVLAGAAKLLKRKLDILGMDACLMSMAEVGYQLREGAMFTVGSEETEPLDGWPYDTILAELAKNPSMNAKDLSMLIVNKYLASYSSDSVTQSACDLSQADALANAVTGLANALKTNLGNATVTQAVLTARTQSQAYEVADNIDLVDFCSLLQHSAIGSTITDRCKDVISAAQQGYITAQGYKGTGLKDSHGVAIYFPTVAVSPLYAGLDFSQKTGWDSFLIAYLTAVRSRR